MIRVSISIQTSQGLMELCVRSTSMNASLHHADTEERVQIMKDSLLVNVYLATGNSSEEHDTVLLSAILVNGTSSIS